MPIDDGPFQQVVDEALHRVETEGVIVLQKWTCRFCGDRITMSKPNTFYTRGRHEDCSVNPTDETNIQAAGCNYLMIRAGTQKGLDTLSKIMGEAD